MIYAVGLGPGDEAYLAPRARQALSDCDVVVGYSTYIKIIEDIIGDKSVVQTGMTGEVERCQKAVDLAMTGKEVAVVSSGDAGIYGMAPLLFQLAEDKVAVEVIPGITAANAAASILGAPLANDYVSISLSDLMTPWQVIENRLRAVSQADLVTCLYNPMSKGRPDYLRKACDIALESKPADTICGTVRNALRGEPEVWLGTLQELRDRQVDMFTLVIMGNRASRLLNGKMVTDRGYQL